MNKYFNKMRKVLYLSVILLNTIWCIASNVTTINSQLSNSPNYHLIENSNQKISFTLDINSYELFNIETLDNNPSILRSENSVPILEKGSPDLPKFVQSVIIPDADKMELVVEAGEYIEIKNIEIAPSKGNIKRDKNPADISFSWNESYNENSFYPNTLAKLNTPYVFRDYRGQAIDIYPFQYNPVTKVLRIYTSINVTLSNTNEEGLNPKTRNSNSIPAAEFYNLYKKQFLNYSNSQKYAVVPEDGAMLVIAHDDFYEQTKELVSWKMQKGMDIELFKSSGISNSSLDIYNFVNDYYIANNITYLLLVGDADHISPLYKSGDSDAAFGHLEGNDSYAEVFVGRLSAETSSELAVQIQKTIYYERDMDESHDWLNQAIGIASAEGGASIGDNNETDKEHMNKIREDLLGFGYSLVDQVYDPGASSSIVINNINEGRSLINYVGHGSNTEMVTSSFGTSQIAQLKNYNKFPFVFDVACVNGNFNGLTCFAENFMRASDDTIPTGAVAIIASTINQDWAPPMNAQDEMVDILTESYENNIKRTFGGITINGCMFMNDNYGSSGSNMTNTWTIFGDPSLMVRTKTPEIISASYAKYIVAGMESFTVECDAEGSLVALTSDTKILAKGIIQNGKVVLNLPFITQEFKATLTITGYNKVTFIDTVDFILANGPFLYIENIQIDDSKGNNDSIVDYTETVTLNIGIKNIGSEMAENVVLTLIDKSGYVTLQDNCLDQSLSLIDPSELVATSGMFTFDIADSVPNNTKLEFELVVKMDGSTENNILPFSINARAPELVFIDYLFNELQEEPNGRIDAGEEIEFIFPISNIGSTLATDVDFSFIALSPYLNVIDTRIVAGEIEVNDTAELILNIKFHSSSPDGNIIKLLLEANAGIIYTDTQEITIGQKPELYIGEGVEEISKYPFNNFYQANKTQIIYTNTELGGGTKSIEGVSFDLSRAPESADKRWLTNFKIKIAHTQLTEHSADYSSTSGSGTVLEKDFQLPETLGEVYIAFDKIFEYNGEDNIIIEFSWGQNSYYANSNSFMTLASKTENQMVAYGYQDNTSYPKYVGTSDMRPNIVFYSLNTESQILNANFKVINSSLNLIHSDAKVFIGGLELITDQDGITNTMLAVGNYNISVDAGYSSMVDMAVAVSVDGEIFEIDMAKTSTNEFYSSQIKIYPNPAKGTINISLPVEEANIRLLNISGQVMLESKLVNSSAIINIDNILPGIYLLEIEHNDFSINKKVVVVE